MDNVVKSLKIKCVEAGTNLTSVCRAVGVNRSMIDRWQRKEPKSLQTLRKIEEHLRELKDQRK